MYPRSPHGAVAVLTAGAEEELMISSERSTADASLSFFCLHIYFTSMKHRLFTAVLVFDLMHIALMEQ